MTTSFFKSAAGPTESDRPNQLEGEFKTDLHDSLAARADERIAGREVWRQAKKNTIRKLWMVSRGDSLGCTQNAGPATCYTLLIRCTRSK
jgi:hypothetical protein